MFKKAASAVAAFGGAGLTAAFLTLTTTGLIQDEGLRLTPYLDSAGIPTDCVGNTKGVKMGTYRTEAECMTMLRDEIVSVDKALGRCIKVELPDLTRSALVRWAYNVGNTAACWSSTVKLLNSGKTEEACRALAAWNKITVSGAEAKKLTKRGETCRTHPTKPGKQLCTLRGLTERREREIADCMKGIGK